MFLQIISTSIKGAFDGGAPFRVDLFGPVPGLPAQPKAAKPLRPCTVGAKRHRTKAVKIAVNVTLDTRMHCEPEIAKIR